MPLNQETNQNQSGSTCLGRIHESELQIFNAIKFGHE